MKCFWATTFDMRYHDVVRGIYGVWSSWLILLPLAMMVWQWRKDRLYIAWPCNNAGRIPPKQQGRAVAGIEVASILLLVMLILSAFTHIGIPVFSDVNEMVSRQLPKVKAPYDDVHRTIILLFSIILSM